MTKRIRRAIGFCLAAAALCVRAEAKLLITEVVPGVSTTATAGDTVEIYNTGPGAVDLTGCVLSDLDPASAESAPATEGSFAPLSLALPPLAAGDFAVVVFTLNTGAASFIQANYGLKIFAPLVASGSMFDSTYEQVALFDGATPTPNAVDSVVWRDDGSAPSNASDTQDDLAALTPATKPAGFAFTLTPDAQWAGPDAIPDLATYQANAADLTGRTAVTTYGGGVLRRRSVEAVFNEGAPDGPAQWESVDRTDATLGNFSGLVAAPGGYLPIQDTDNITTRVEFLRSTIHPDRRIDILEDVNRFTEPSGADIAAWRLAVRAARAGQWVDAFGLAQPLGYELVEFLDTITGATFYILQEAVEPGDPGYRGLGIYIFDLAPEADAMLILQAPHPIHDSLTLEELALAIPQLRPRAAMISGTHRNNHTSVTPCDGTFEDGSSYRISDVAHYAGNFFEPAHEELEGYVANTCVIQFHGFSAAAYPALAHDVVVSNGVGAPALGAAARVIAARIDAQGFIANDGLGGDLTTAAIYGVDTFSLGATNNLQGRFTNGVAPGAICDTPALAASEHFIHIEQDLDVRQEPQHIITALQEALAIVKGPTPSPTPIATASVSPSSTASATASPTPSVSASPTASATASLTPTASASVSPSATPSPTPNSAEDWAEYR